MSTTNNSTASYVAVVPVMGEKIELDFASSKHLLAFAEDYGCIPTWNKGAKGGVTAGKGGRIPSVVKSAIREATIAAKVAGHIGDNPHQLPIYQIPETSSPAPDASNDVSVLTDLVTKLAGNVDRLMRDRENADDAKQQQSYKRTRQASDNREKRHARQASDNRKQSGRSSSDFEQECIFIADNDGGAIDLELSTNGHWYGIQGLGDKGKRFTINGQQALAMAEFVNDETGLDGIDILAGELRRIAGLQEHLNQERQEKQEQRVAKQERKIATRKYT